MQIFQRESYQENLKRKLERRFAHATSSSILRNIMTGCHCSHPVLKKLKFFERIREKRSIDICKQPRKKIKKFLCKVLQM
jgi:hypothetical protein